MDNSNSYSDFEIEEERMREITQRGAHALDHQLHVRFYKHAELNSFRSKEEGRKIFDEHVYIMIVARANRLNEINRRATDDDKVRFAKQYQAYLQNQEQLQSGTPLRDLRSLTASQVMELNAVKVTTIEQLAGLPDATVQTLGTGGADLKRRAQVFLDRYAQGEAQGERIRSLEAQLEELLAERRTMAEVADTVKVTPQASSPLKVAAPKA